MKHYLAALLAATTVVITPINASALDKPTGRPILTISGAISAKNADGANAQLDATMLDKLPQVKMTVPTPWYKTPQTFEGPLFRDVLQLAGAKGNKLYVVALNDYAAEIPINDLTKYDVILARKINGKPLSVRDKGPLFVMYPMHKHPELQNKDILSRCVWQVNRIRVE